MADAEDVVTPIAQLVNIQRDEDRAEVARKVREYALLAEHADTIAATHFSMYQAYRKAGFDDYDAKELASGYRPRVL